MKLSVDTSKTKSVICVILFSLFFIFWHVSGYAETIPKNDSPDILELRQRGSKLYTQFLKFKKEQDFINSGFGNSKSHDKYEQWLKEVDLLIKTSSEKLPQLLTTITVKSGESLEKKYLESEEYSIYIASFELKSLAVLTANSSGEETAKMKKKKEIIESQFILKE